MTNNNEIIISEGYYSLTQESSSKLDSPFATVIIDGVNVAECVFLDYKCHTMCEAFRVDKTGFHQGMCMRNSNCYYKQLQRCKAKQRNVVRRLSLYAKAEKQKNEELGKYNKIWKETAHKLFTDKKCLMQGAEILENLVLDLRQNYQELENLVKEKEMFYFNASKECSGWRAKCEELEQSEKLLKDRLKRLDIGWNKSINKNTKYKQALADIKDVIERQDCDNCLKQLAKINEVCGD